MKNLRLWYAALLLWFCVLFNVERLFAPINLASPIYVLAPIVALAMLVTPKLHSAPPLGLAVLAALVVLPVKMAFGYQAGGQFLPLTVTEVLAVVITALVAGRITVGLNEFRAAVATTMSSHLYDRSRSFSEGQAAMCREVRRARVHARPLALLALRPTGAIPEVARARFTREVEQEMLGKYITARLGEVLSTELHDSDVIVYRDGHFVVLLPEADSEQARRSADRLVAAARHELGLEIEVGSAVFPNEEITFVRLLERAEQNMRGAASDEFPEGAATVAPVAVSATGRGRENGTLQPAAVASLRATPDSETHPVASR